MDVAGSRLRAPRDRPGSRPLPAEPGFLISEIGCVITRVRLGHVSDRA